MRVLRLREVHRSRTAIAAACEIDDLSFHFTVWYEDVDLVELARAYGDELLDRLAFHVAMFQLDALVSLRPDVIELGPYARFAGPRFVELWSTIVERVWAQWRFENDQPDYRGPRFADSGVDGTAVHAPAGATELLSFCGGGKDSLVAMKLLERGKLPFATLGYACSSYGAAAPQHVLIDRLASHSARVRAERMWVVDDFLDAPVVRTRPDLGVKTITAAETPASVFAALPLALARGYRGLVVAHERSANAPQIGDVNHQWGKGWDAEKRIDDYINAELLAGVRYFSLLQPVHDEVIFELLARDGELAPLTHSCNVDKPWCGACAKCAYVWLQMAAHLPERTVDATFGDDLGERAANDRWFRELFGLAEHAPFECVGSVPEARLALAQLAAKRALGPRLGKLAAEVGPLDIAALAAPYVEVGDIHGMPAAVAAAVMPQLVDAAMAARRRLIP